MEALRVEPVSIHAGYLEGSARFYEDLVEIERPDVSMLDLQVGADLARLEDDARQEDEAREASLYAVASR